MVLSQIRKGKQRGLKQVALLIDPDKTGPDDLGASVIPSLTASIDFFLIGGSLVSHGSIDACIQAIRTHSNLPVVIFPGHENQLSREADAVLLLSLISGRNPDFLIGKHVQAAHDLKKSQLEVIPTGYMLVDSGSLTSANYISNTIPLPANKPELTSATALAGAFLGMKLLYLDAGSGARQPVPGELIRAVAQEVELPLIVGGGIRDASSAMAASEAGADVLVLGTSFEEDPSNVTNLSSAFKRIHNGVSSRIQL